MGNLFESVVGFVFVLLIILFSMTLHELMHGFVAYKLGDETAKDEGRLTFNPIKHLDPIYSLILPLCLYIIGGPVFGGAKPVPVNCRNLKWKEWGMALVAIAGPITNFLLAFISFLLRLLLNKMFGNELNEFIDLFLQYSVSINLGFFAFNILPLPPLDGSRILYALAPDTVRNIMNYLEGFGVWIIYGLIFLFGGLFSGIMLDISSGVYSFFLWIVGL